MLVLEDITVSITDENRQSRKILDGVSFEVEPDSFFVITGPNGGGKSTLARVIMGIHRPDSGRVIFDGQDITELDVTARARLGIGFAFQQPVSFKGLTVQDLLSLASGRPLTVEETCACLSEVGMCAREYTTRELNSTLSGGEKKRVEIAMLMARGARLSVFDEPEAGIDLWSYQNLIQVFNRIRKARKGAAVIISHQERILGIADKVVVIEQGRLTHIGKREEVLPALGMTTRPCGITVEGVR